MSLGTYETLLILAGICLLGAAFCLLGAGLDSRHFKKRRKMAEYNQTVDRR